MQRGMPKNEMKCKCQMWSSLTSNGRGRRQANHNAFAADTNLHVSQSAAKEQGEGGTRKRKYRKATFYHSSFALCTKTRTSGVHSVSQSSTCSHSIFAIFSCCLEPSQDHMRQILTLNSRSVSSLRTLIIVADADGTFLGQSIGPEAFERSSTRGELASKLQMHKGCTHPDIASWVKRSQKPKTGLARTSRTA